jgi:hypothetical protein
MSEFQRAPQRPPHRVMRRSHRRAVPCSFDTESFLIWFPDPDEPIALESFADVAAVAFEVHEMPAHREVLVLLDELRRVTAIVLDPPPAVGVFVGWSELPGLEVPFSQTMSIALVDEVGEGPPSHEHREGYFSLRRIHMLQGLQLLDVVLVDTEHVRSLAIACDPDAIWFEPFTPFAPPSPNEAAPNEAA